MKNLKARIYPFADCPFAERHRGVAWPARALRVLNNQAAGSARQSRPPERELELAGGHEEGYRCNRGQGGD